MHVPVALLRSKLGKETSAAFGFRLDIKNVDGGGNGGLLPCFSHTVRIMPP